MKKGLRLVSDDYLPLLAKNKQFLTLPPPYEGAMSNEDSKKIAPDMALPPTMMEKSLDKTSSDKQSKSDDGGKQ